MWELAVFLCFLFAVTYPDINRGGCALLFCMSAIIPELVPVSGAPYFLFCSAVSVAILAAVTKFGRREICIYNSQELILGSQERYIYNLQKLLLCDVCLNIIGLALWYTYASVHISNYIFDITSYSLANKFGELFIYKSLAIVFYIVSAYIIYDRGMRSDRNSIIDVITNWASSYRSHVGVQ